MMRTLADPAFWIAALNLGFIAALPRVFFRRGRLNLHWWLTAAPFFLAGTALLLYGSGLPGTFAVGATTAGGVVTAATRLAGTTCCIGSVALIAFTLGTHRQRVSLWHQPDDTPPALVTHGAYARVRHPFYSAFLVALTGCVLVAPSIWMGTALAFALVQLRRTALREETRLLHRFGAAYAVYMAHTGRFLPRTLRG